MLRMPRILCNQTQNSYQLCSVWNDKFGMHPNPPQIMCLLPRVSCCCIMLNIVLEFVLSSVLYRFLEKRVNLPLSPFLLLYSYQVKFSPLQLSWLSDLNKEWSEFLICSLVFSFELLRVDERTLDQGPTFNLVFSHQWMRKVTFFSIKYFLSQLALKFIKKSLYSLKWIIYLSQAINTMVMSFVPF